jgi:hypothetical protein
MAAKYPNTIAGPKTTPPPGQQPRITDAMSFPHAYRPLTTAFEPLITCALAFVFKPMLTLSVAGVIGKA